MTFSFTTFSSLLSSSSLGVVVNASRTAMNSLTYLSRQFDVLASPRTPPSTPTSDLTPPVQDSLSSRRMSTSDTSLKRVKTWSSKSFLFAHPPHYTKPFSIPRRSFSTPADFHSASSMHRSQISSAPDGTRPSRSHLRSLLRGLFFLRLFVLLWMILRDAWASITRMVTPSRETSREASSETDDKESEDETSDEKPTSLRQTEPPLKDKLPPPVPSADAAPLPYINPPNDEFPIHSKIKAEPTSTPPTHGASAVSSRSSTPPQTARKTPFHLPKTLILDLDETLIHSTSRPMNSYGSGGTNLLGLNSFGRRNKGIGHTVEVTLGGRSTIYHVYKRPFVDFFLRTVRYYTQILGWTHPPNTGFRVVHPCHIHCFHARVREPGHRLARCWPRYFRKTVFPGCMYTRTHSLSILLIFIW